MNEYFIGIMSGTSLDGVDAALVDFAQGRPNFIEGVFQPFDETLKAKLQELLLTAETSLQSFGEVDVLLGKSYAQAVQQLLKTASIQPEKIKAIGCHGQTIFHSPSSQQPFTLQLGNGATLHAATRIPVINDFRRMDVALGGQGAPLAPAFHEFSMRNPGTDRIALNIGGIANISILWKDQERPILGFDTGPGNTLMDLWANKHLGEAYDNGGVWAMTGKPIPNLLSSMLTDEYFNTAPPKSTGREYFNLPWLGQQLARLNFTPKPEDVQHTLTQLTAQTITQSIAIIGPSEGEIWVCGGGANNQFLMNQLKISCPKFSVKCTSELGIDSDYMEAIAFAWLARQRLLEEKIDLTHITGAKAPALLGNIIKH